MSYIKRVRYMEKCPPYTNPRIITPTKGVLHSTGCAQQKIMAYINAENTASTNAAVSGFIGEDSDGVICYVQTLPYTYRAWHVGSGSRGSYNNNGPGIEVCEPSAGQTYNGGTMSNFDKEASRPYFNKVKQIAIEVWGDFCKEFNLDPYDAIVDHQEAHQWGYGSNHGDIKHWWDRYYGYTMNDFRKDVKAYMTDGSSGAVDNGTALMGAAKATAAQLKAYIKTKNPEKKWQDIVDIFLDEGLKEGVKGDVAFAQSCLETGHFTFKGDVKESQNNFAGIGATGGGAAGAQFPDVRTGVRAQIQHLKAYASKDALKQPCVDPRFNLVNRGSATTIDGLAGKWATDTSYGKKITSIYSAILSIDNTQTDSTPSGGTETLYRVQTGAFSVAANAYALEAKLLATGFSTCIAKADGFYKVQVGAYKNKTNAEQQLAKVKQAGFDGFITTNENKEISGTIDYQPTQKLKYATGDYKITASSLNVRTGPSTEYAKKSFNELTINAQQQGGYSRGVVFTALEIVNGTTEAWARTPSGWVCLEYHGDVYAQRV